MVVQLCFCGPEDRIVTSPPSRSGGRRSPNPSHTMPSRSLSLLGVAFRRTCHLNAANFIGALVSTCSQAVRMEGRCTDVQYK